MDERIVNILNILDNDDSLSQREISRRTNISLGTVNALISHCIKTGLIKVKRLNSRNIRYVLTCEGMKELTKKSITYIQKSYQAIVEIQRKVRELAEEKTGEGKTIILLGKEDEIYQLAVNALEEAKIDFQHRTGIEGLPQDDSSFLIYWDPEYCDIKDMKIESKNIFSRK